MPRTCTVCAHRRRARIDAALANGTSLRAIAGRFGASKTALQRHRAHVGATLQRAAERRGQKVADSTMDRLERIQAKLWALLQGMEAAGDLRGAVGALREARELVAAIDAVVARAKPAEAERLRMTPEERREAMIEQLGCLGHTRAEAAHLLRMIFGEDDLPPQRRRAPTRKSVV